MAQRISVTWGEELYAPVQYNSFRNGAMTIELDVVPPETVEQAHERALGILRGLSKKQFAAQRDAFLENYRDATAKARR